MPLDWGRRQVIQRIAEVTKNGSRFQTNDKPAPVFDRPAPADGCRALPTRLPARTNGCRSL